MKSLGPISYKDSILKCDTTRDESLRVAFKSVLLDRVCGVPLWRGIFTWFVVDFGL
jgi:hypothetical protein